MNYLADKSYVALKVQAAANTPVVPNFFIPLVSESIRLIPAFAADRRLKGLDWKSDDLLPGSRKIEGDLVLLADPDALGHLLNMTYAKGSTTGSALVGYTHPFAPGDGKSYSLDIPRGDYAQRIWGVRGDSIKVEFEDNKMKATISIKALGQFFGASLAVALTGAGMVSAVLKTDSSYRPADGLAVGDSIKVGGVDVVLTSVNADGKTIGFASTAITASVGDPVYLKAQTPSFTNLQPPLYLGNTLIGVAANSAAADTAAATKATATPCYGTIITFKNNLLDAPASGSEGAGVLLNQVKEGSIALSRLFETPDQFRKWIEAAKQAITVIATGGFIKTDLTTSEALTVKLHKVKLMTHEDPLEVGAYIFDKQTFEALYDSVDGKAVEITLVNRTADTAY